MRNVSPKIGSEQQANILDEEGLVVMEIAKVIEKGRKYRLPALRNVLKKKLLEDTAKVDKVLIKFKTCSITNTNELFYAGAVVITNILGVKTDKEADRKKPMWKRRL